MNTPRDPERHQREAVIMAAATNAAGWTREALKAWGVPWPPPPGWKDTLIRHGFPYQPEKNNRASKKCRKE